MSKLTRATIKAAIDQYLCDADLQETYQRMNQALDYVTEAKFSEEEWTKEHIVEYVLLHNYALDTGEVMEGTELWNDIDKILNDIVEFFEA